MTGEARMRRDAEDAEEDRLEEEEFLRQEEERMSLQDIEIKNVRAAPVVERQGSYVTSASAPRTVP